MREQTWERDNSGMVYHAHRRKEEKRKRVEEIIAQLLRQQQTINFNSVAKAAGVSKAYLYSQTDIRERIEALRQQAMEQAVRERAAHPTPGKTDPGKDPGLLAKDPPI